MVVCARMREQLIFVVEDEPADCEAISRVLRHESALTVRYFSDGDEVLRALVNEALPDLILLDLNLPRTSGLEVLKVLKESPALKAIPVIVFSGAAEGAVRDSAYDGFANCFVAKPSQPEEFRQVVDRILQFFVHTAQPVRIGA